MPVLYLASQGSIWHSFEINQGLNLRERKGRKFLHGRGGYDTLCTE
ncbi:MAG: hypothetical protein ABSH44_09890 [Bryobacteraceae bacterium]